MGGSGDLNKDFANVTYELLQRLQIRLPHIFFGTTTYVHKNPHLNKVSTDSNPGRKRYFRQMVHAKRFPYGVLLLF